MIKKVAFKGIWPAMFTPVEKSGEPAYDELAKLVELLINQQVDGLYILGSTGQGILFTEDQRKKIAAMVCRLAAGRVPVMVQVGALTTEVSVRLAKHAAEAGARAISSVGPIYYSGSAESSLKHYHQIARATNLPFFPYQLGSHTIPGNIESFIDQLLEIPNVQGMKLTTTQLLEISAIHNYAKERLLLFSGCDELFCHARLCGTVGAIGSFYNLWAEDCKQVMDAFTGGNYHLAQAYMLALQKAVNQVLPNIWTFFRKAMLLKYQIDIGNAKAPLGNTNEDWQDEQVMEILDQVASVAATASRPA
ncbi:dihydrodipicolinate synthase family protein [Niabella aurantiaca]|uniref:dihydrodipicolinate synthase family protein n=1 Tax=Niabella aurantiaca TaxID=379900 RepID=UPI0003669AE6|nr:dihydrodipicolinate synthase family protein [Niabella aurantiaca]